MNTIREVVVMIFSVSFSQITGNKKTSKLNALGICTIHSMKFVGFILLAFVFILRDYCFCNDFVLGLFGNKWNV